MPFSSSIDFVRRFFDCYRIPLNILSPESTEAGVMDTGLRSSIYKDYDYSKILLFIKENINDKVLYLVEDVLECRYYIFKFPDKDDDFVFVGPYRLEADGFSKIDNISERLDISPTKQPVVEKIYSSISCFDDDRHIHNAMLTLCSIIWDGIDNFEVKEKYDLIKDSSMLHGNKAVVSEPEDTILSMRLLEERYNTERLIMDAVSHGQVHKAEMYLSNMSALQMEKRSIDPIRNMKNYSVILNTLLRKAVEQGGVHPLHIDSVSSKFAKKIEGAHSVSALIKTQKEMIQKYCALVKNHSLKGYSQLIRKVITRIESDLSADLSLSCQAELLNVNPSYLSTLFKKETGQTLTEFVNRKRVENAAYLLTSTSLQVQVIAQQCGIPDVNYFSKTFKKFTGKSPKEVRETGIVM